MMEIKMLNIALFTPSIEAYSETFIQMHRYGISGHVKYYYGGHLPTHLDGEGALLKNMLLRNKFGRRLVRILLPSLTRKYCQKALKRSLIENNVDAVICEYGPTAAESIGVCKELKIPQIVYFHGYDASVKGVLDKYKKEYSEVFSYAKYIIVVSDLMKRDLVALGSNPDKTIVNRCPPSNEYFNICLESDVRSPQFISVGRFVEKKAPHLTILAFDKVVKKHPQCKLFFCGNGPLLDKCINLVDQLGLSDSVVFMGIVNKNKIIEMFKSSTCYIQHSVTASNGDMEGTPVSIMEASAAGLPVISTFHAGIPEVIINNVTGYLVNENDIEGMSNAMLNIISDPANAIEMGLKGREFISENYTEDKHLQIINDLVSNVKRL